MAEKKRKLVSDAAGLKREAKVLGADLVGIASAESFSRAPEGHRPEDILEGARSVVVMAIHLLDASLENPPNREYSVNYSVVNHELNRLAFRIAKLLQVQGFRAVQVPSSPPYDLKNMMGDLSHRHAGYLAGIGVFGKNSLLLSPDHGPRIRLVSVVTDAPLEPDRPLEIDLCGSCTLCVRSCPTGALKGAGKVDKRVCDAHHVEIGEELQLDSWDQVCGVCIGVCPVGRKARHASR